MNMKRYLVGENCNSMLLVKTRLKVLVCYLLICNCKGGRCNKNILSVWSWRILARECKKQKGCCVYMTYQSFCIAFFHYCYTIPSLFILTLLKCFKFIHRHFIFLDIFFIHRKNYFTLFFSIRIFTLIYFAKFIYIKPNMILCISF